MDKFGIFKILSSLLQSFNGSKQSSDNLFDKQNAPSSEGLPQNLADVFNLFKSHGDKKEPPAFEQKPSEKEKSVENPSSATPFLKHRLLQTSTSHDEFVKRVKGNNSP